MKRSPFKVKPDAKPMKRNSSLSPRSAVARKKRAAKPAEELKRKRATRVVGKAKKAKKPQRKTLVTTLDRVASIFVRKVAGNRCVQCGSTEQPTCGHLFGRRAYSVRWDLENIWCQCWPCNYRHIHNPYPYFKWFIDKFGQERLDDLHRRFNTPTKVTDADLQRMIEDFKRRIAELDSGDLPIFESPARGRNEEAEAA